MDNAFVRLAKPEEIKQVQDLNHELFLSDAMHFNDLNINWPYEKECQDYFRDRIAGKDGACFVAELNKNIVGYVAGGWSHTDFSVYRGKRAELENICVTPNARSRGVGAKLVAAFYDWCKENGAEYVMVDIYAPNIRAYEFYKKQGFEAYSNVLWHKIQRGFSENDSKL